MSDPDVSLRPIRLDDWPAVHAWARLPEASRYQLWGPNTEEQTESFVRSAVHAWGEQPRTRLVYAAHVDGEVLGVGELRIQNAVHRQSEIRYAVHPRVWGRGIGTAIARSLLEVGFTELRLHRIYASSDPRNIGSVRVQEKLGMEYEGRLRHVAWLADGWRDTEVRSMLADEWTSRAPPLQY